MSDAKVTLYAGKLKALDNAVIRALEQTTEALHSEIVQAQVIPFRTGHLQNDSTFTDFERSGEGYTEIVSSTPYARRLYYHPEYHFNREENVNAKGKWFEDWEHGGANEDFAAETFAALFKREAGL